MAPQADYAIVRVDGHDMIFAYEMISQVAEAAEWTRAEVLCEDGFMPVDVETGQHEGTPILAKGKAMEGLTYICPIRQDLKGKII